MGDSLQLLGGIGGNLEYEGPKDPRWSVPRLLGVDGMSGRVVPLDQASVGEKTPSATPEQVASYSVKPYQRLLIGTDGTFWVVNALFRLPPLTNYGDQLHPLSPHLRLTQEEMEVLGPWLGLRPIETQTGFQYRAYDMGPNSLDAEASNGIDHLFQTAYDWNRADDVGVLLLNLLRFKQVREGALPHESAWPVDFQADRLEALIAAVEARSEELAQRENLGVENLLAQMQRHPLNTVAGLLAGASAIVFTAGAFHSGWRGGFEYLLRPLRGGTRAIPYLARFGKAAMAGTSGLSAISRALGAVGAPMLGDYVGGLMTDGAARMIGLVDDPDYHLMRFAYDQMLAEAMPGGRVTTFFFGNIIMGIQGLESMVNPEFERLVFEGLELKIESLVRASRDFGDTLAADLLRFVLESRDHRHQINTRLFREKVYRLYAEQKEGIPDAYRLLALTGHHAPQALRLKQLIAEDGTIRDLGLLKMQLRKIETEKRNRKEILHLLDGGGIPATLLSQASPSPAERGGLTMGSAVLTPASPLAPRARTKKRRPHAHASPIRGLPNTTPRASRTLSRAGAFVASPALK